MLTDSVNDFHFVIFSLQINTIKMTLQTEIQVLLGFILGSLVVSTQHFGMRLQSKYAHTFIDMIPMGF